MSATEKKTEAPNAVAFQGRGQSSLVLELFILGCIYVLAFCTRLFAVIRYESIIHEFDPWFNFRVTKYLVKEGFYNFHNWFDSTTWYPLGRYIGGTLYPGLMWTAALVFHSMNYLGFTINIRNVCVLLAPFMASNTTIAVYLLAKETWTSAAALIAALFISLTPGYTSRSVGGSYDNEAVAIFALTITFYLWVKSVKTGSMFWSAMCSLGYFYMVASWGGYIFIINLIPVHALVLLLSGRYTHRLYVAYTIFYVLGTIMSMNISFVQFIPVTSPEHMPSVAVFGLLHLWAGFLYVRSMLPKPEYVRSILIYFVVLLFGLMIALALLSAMGYIPFLTGRLLSLLGSTKNIAIVKSVSEHQPSAWTTFWFDFQSMTFFCIVGLYYCFRRVSDATIFGVLYVVFSAYFASIMVRLVLVMAPGACVMSAIGVSETITRFTDALNSTPSSDSVLLEEEPVAAAPTADDDEDDDAARKAKVKTKMRAVAQKYGKLHSSREVAIHPLIAVATIVFVTVIGAMYVVHCSWVTSVAYSSPSVVLMARNADGSRTVFDDFREAYYWLRHNTADDAKIMSWWDYGYQIKGMGNRTVIVDNNTRNNTHIATVGLAMASTEEDAYPILRMLDVDYVLVIFGGKIGYSSDDINKFLWMVRISSGVFPRIVESDYFSKDGQYRIDMHASKIMKKSMMYKMCFYRFGELFTEYGQPLGYDRVRRAVIGDPNVSFKYMEEAFTSEHWMVRIYRVLKEADLPGGVDFPAVPEKKRKALKKVKELYKDRKVQKKRLIKEKKQKKKDEAKRRREEREASSKQRK